MAEYDDQSGAESRSCELDAATLWVDGVCAARRLGPNVVVEVYGLGMSDTLYPSDGVAALVAAVERHMMTKAKKETNHDA
jgi:hypothetical protein